MSRNTALRYCIVSGSRAPPDAPSLKTITSACTAEISACNPETEAWHFSTRPCNLLTSPSRSRSHASITASSVRADPTPQPTAPVSSRPLQQCHLLLPTSPHKTVGPGRHPFCSEEEAIGQDQKHNRCCGLFCARAVSPIVSSSTRSRLSQSAFGMENPKNDTFLL